MQRSEPTAERVGGRATVTQGRGHLGLLVRGRFWGCGERPASVALFLWFSVILMGNREKGNPPFPLPVPVLVIHLCTWHLHIKLRASLS